MILYERNTKIFICIHVKVLTIYNYFYEVHEISNYKFYHIYLKSVLILYYLF